VQKIRQYKNTDLEAVLSSLDMNFTPNMDSRWLSWGRGFATEAAEAVRDYAFSTLGLNQLVSLIQTHNLASKRVSEKLGMNLLRTFTRSEREYALYSIIAEESHDAAAQDQH
jgi:Acetyltransferase (GNAT) domain